MEMAKVTSKGQITIPVSIRRRLQIDTGDNLLFIDRPDGVMMVNPDLLGNGEEIDTVSEPVEKAKPSKDIVLKEKSVKKVTDTKAYEEIEEEPDDIPAPVVKRPSTADIIRPSTDRIAEKKIAKVGDLNLDSLLDVIRSIGRKI